MKEPKNTRSRCVALNGRDIHHTHTHTHLLVIEATGPGEIYTFSGVEHKDTKPSGRIEGEREEKMMMKAVPHAAGSLQNTKFLAAITPLRISFFKNKNDYYEYVYPIGSCEVQSSLLMMIIIITINGKTLGNIRGKIRPSETLRSRCFFLN